jgi:hypothetical protein
MNKSVRVLLASVSPVALAAGFSMLSSPAEAINTITAQNVSYATENFGGASSASSIIVSSTGIVITTGASTSDIQAGSLTLTLSNGAVFAAVPPVTGTTNGAGATSGSLSTGTSTAVTYTTAAPTTTAASISFGNFTVTGVGTRLATSANAITVTMSGTGINLPGTASGTIAISSQAYSFTAPSNGNTVTIDLANGGAGTVFRSGTPASNVTFATLGSLTLGDAAAANDIGGATRFTLGSSDILRAVVNGNLSAFSSVYAIPSGSCAATAPATAISATINSTSTSATMSPVVQGSTYTICAVANGTTIVPAGSITGNVGISFSSRTVSGATYTPNQVSQSSSTLATSSYNGSTGTAFYVVGAGSYTSAIRLTNNSTSNATVFVQVTADTSATPVRALLDSSLVAGQSKFYFASDIRTAVGTSVLADSNTRATVVFLSSAGGLQTQNFIVNPGGVLSGGTSVGTSNTTGN